MTSPSRPVLTRVKRGAAFIAIVWALAASFVAFDLAALAGLDLALGTHTGRTLGLSDQVRKATTCTGAPGTRVDATRVSDAAVTVWVLGVMAGTHAFLSRWDNDGAGSGDGPTPRWRAIAQERSAQAARNVAQLAAHLQVPKPGPFEARNRADANTAYVTAVETDDNGTARSIAGMYGEAACHVYKLGAYWGYGAEFRMAIPGRRSVFGLEIEYHGRKARVPERLWTPVLAATPPNATTEHLVKETQELTVAITDHLTNSR